MILDKIITMYGKLLIAVYDNSIIVNGQYMIPFTQVELTKMLNTNKTTVNNLFKEYKEDGLVEQNGSRYFLTDKAVDIVKKIKKIKH